MSTRTWSQSIRWLVSFIGLILVLVYSLPACQTPAQATPTPTRTPRSLAVPTTPAHLQVTTPTPVVATTPQSTPDARIQTDFPPDVNPLTGEKVPDPATLNRRPLAVKISNFPPLVRPQQGLSQADLVFEHPAEGGVTRFTAVFLGHTPELAGSVRSGRYIDLEIPQMYQALFAYSGSSQGLKAKFRASNFFDRIVSPDFGAPESGDPFARIPQGDAPYEHTLFAKPDLIWRWAEANGVAQQGVDLHGLAFSDAPTQAGPTANQVVIPFQAGDWAESVEWTYNASSGRYLRSIEGAPHTDAATAAQLAFANVILIWSSHTIDCQIQEDGVGFEAACSASGHFSRQIHLINADPNQSGGKAAIFRDGQRFEGVWNRAQASDMLTLAFPDGHPMPLKRGPSWFEMLPLDFEIQVQ